MLRVRLVRLSMARSGGIKVPVCISPPFFLPYPPLPSSTLSFFFPRPSLMSFLSSLQLEGLGERCKLPSWVWVEPQPKSDLVRSTFKQGRRKVSETEEARRI